MCQIMCLRQGQNCRTYCFLLCIQIQVIMCGYFQNFIKNEIVGLVLAREGIPSWRTCSFEKDLIWSWHSTWAILWVCRMADSWFSAHASTGKKGNFSASLIKVAICWLELATLCCYKSSLPSLLSRNEVSEQNLPMWTSPLQGANLRGLSSLQKLDRQL